MWNTRNSVKRETYVKDILKETRQSDDVNEQMDSLGTIHILRKQLSWRGVVHKKPFFVYF